MKTLIIIISFLTLTLSAIAQRLISYDYTEVNKAEFDSCSKTSFLIVNPQFKKKSSKLTIPISRKPARILKDDKSDENFHEFDCLGTIKGTKLSLIKRTDYNSEEFYLINRSTGAVDTLIGQPVFAANMKYFSCINKPGTDEKKQIQVCELKNGSVKTRGYLKAKANTILEEISCINQNYILARDDKGKYWKMKF